VGVAGGRWGGGGGSVEGHDEIKKKIIAVGSITREGEKKVRTEKKK